MSQIAFALNQEDAGFEMEPEAAPGPAMSAEAKAALAAEYADEDSEGTLVDSHQDWGDVPETQDPDAHAGRMEARAAIKRVAEEEEAGRRSTREALAKRYRAPPDEEEQDPLSVYFGNVPLVKFRDLDPMGRELVRARAQYRLISPLEDVNTFGFLCEDCSIDGNPLKAGVYPAPKQQLYPLSLMEPEDAAKYRALIAAVHGGAVDVPLEALVALEPPAGHRIATREVYRTNAAVGFNQIQAGTVTFVDLYAPNAAPVERPVPRAPAPAAMSAPLRARVIAAPAHADITYTGRKFRKRPDQPVGGMEHVFEHTDMGVRPDRLTEKERRARAKADAVLDAAMGRKLGSERYPYVIE